MQNSLTLTVKQYAREEGFDPAGVASPCLPDFYGEALSRWVDAGFAGSMAYMARDPKRRARPDETFPWARSVVALALNYFHPEDPKPAHAAGKVSKYAYGEDYHRVLEKKLKRLARRVREFGGPGTLVRAFSDTSAVLDRAYAREAGLGFFGKNTNVITLGHGSWVFLATLWTNLELEPDRPHAGSCGSCTLCIEACPTGALSVEKGLEATKCISYLTIESREPSPAPLAPRVGDWIFGCDICQDVCPYNRRAKPASTLEFAAPRAGTWIPLDRAEAAAASDDAFREAFRGSPVKRAKREGLARNARVVRENVR